MTDNLEEVPVDEEGNPIEPEIIEPNLDEEGNPIEEPQPELDEEGNPIEPDTPLWMQEDEQTSSDSMPVAAHIRTKSKLKGQLADKDVEIEKLRSELADKSRTTPAITLTKRPRVADFDTDEAYEDALDQWDNDRATAQVTTIEKGRNHEVQQQQSQRVVDEAVEGHFKRVADIVNKHGIKEDVYAGAEKTFRNDVESLFPNQGDLIADQLITILGEGSEKTIYHMGINSAARDRFKTIVRDNAAGLGLHSAVAYLAGINKEISGTQNKKTSARKPAAQVNGEIAPTASAGKHKKAYDKAVKSNDGQAMYNAKKLAKASKVDVSNW